MSPRSLVSVHVFMAGILILGTLSRAAEPPSIACDEVPRAEVHGKQKILKSFTADFWRLIESKVPSYPPTLQQKGFVIGDFHFANLGLYFDPETNEPRLSPNDLDDSGTNFLVGDLLKFLIYLQTIDKKDLRISDIIDAYSDGLAGRPLTAPRDLRDLLDLKASDFAKKQAKYLNKRKDEAREFNFSSISKKQRETFENLEKLSIFLKLTDIQKWLQMTDSGSSAGMERYLFLASSKLDDSEVLIEFKNLKCSATDPSRRQNVADNYKRATDYLNEINNQNSQGNFLGRQRVLYMGNQFLLYREKQPNVLNDLEIETSKSGDLQKYAQFYAAYLGFVHSKHADQTYQESIQRNKGFIVGQLKPLLKEYIKRVNGDA